MFWELVAYNPKAKEWGPISTLDLDFSNCFQKGVSHWMWNFMSDELLEEPGIEGTLYQLDYFMK